MKFSIADPCNGISKQLELKITNQLSDIKKVEHWLTELSQTNQYSPKTNFSLDLVLNEALINIISYAYTDALSHEIVILLHETDSDIIVIIMDDGKKFNPLTENIPKLSPVLEEASIGGRGILLMKKFCKNLNYCYSNGKNHLMLTIAKA